MKRLAAVLLLLLAAGAAAAVEVPLSLPSVYVPAEGGQRGPAAIASDGENFLAVWIDGRGDTVSTFAARIAADGTVLDPTGIRIGPGGYKVNVVWSGRSYFVFITDLYTDRGLTLVQVGRDGAIVAPPRQLLTDVVSHAFNPAASNGSHVLLAYGRSISGGQWSRRLAVLDADGRLLRSEIGIPDEPDGWGEVAVASNGKDFLAVTVRRLTLSTLRVDADGNLIDPVPTVLATNLPFTIGPLVVSNGTDYLVSVITSRTPSEIITSRVSANGEATPLQATVFSGRSSTEIDFAPTSNGYLAVFRTGPDVEHIELRSHPFNAAGLPFGGEPQLVAPAASPTFYQQPRAASNGSSVYVVWSGFTSPGVEPRIYGRLIGPNGLGAQSLLSISAAEQRDPAGAFDGSVFLTAWWEETGTYIGRISVRGERLDGRGVRISSEGAVAKRPRVIFDGTRFLVVWVETSSGSTKLLLRRIARDGTLLDAAPITAASGCLSADFDLATDGATTMVVWASCSLVLPTFTSLAQVNAARFDNAAGTMIDSAPLQLTAGPLGHGRPRIAYGGGTYLAAFEEQTLLSGPIDIDYSFSVRAARVSPQLVLLDPALIDVTFRDSEESTPAVAWDGAQFFVAWAAADDDGPFNPDVPRSIDGRFVSAQGVLLDGVTVAEGSFVHSSAAFDGSDVVVGFTSVDHDAYAARVRRRNGRVIVGAPFVVSASLDAEDYVQPVPATVGRAAFLYTRAATEPLYGGVLRGFMRVESPGRVRAAR